MSLHAFFDGQDYLHRVSFISGGTDDTYYVNGVLLNSMEYMLEMHLRQIGYDVILFYNGVQGLYCFTRQSAELRDRYFRQPVGEDLNLDSDMAELFGTDGTATPAPESREAPLQIPMSDLEIPGFADKVMRETRVRCALVFSDGWDLLENTNDNAQRTLSNRMRSWYHLESGNHNICLFCFADLSQQHLSDFLRRSLHWSFLEEKILDGNGFSDAVKYISIPGEDEIRQLLASREEYNHATRAERARLVRAARQQLHTMGNSLRGLCAYLEHEPDAFARLLDALEDDSKAMETLRSTRGWEPVAEAIDRMAETVRATGTIAPPQPRENTLYRMNEGRGAFVPPGVCLNMVLKGPPGTGKTSIAKLLGRIYRQMGLLPSGHVVECARDDLVGRYIGHTATNTRAQIQKAMGGILFIDEAYSLYRGGDDSRDFGREAIDTLVEAMTRNVGAFAVVLAGYPEEMEEMLAANPGLRSRFGQNIVTLPDYEPPLLEQIALDYLAGQYASTRLQFDPSLLRPGATGNKPLDVFFRGWFDARDRRTFGNARDVRNLVDGLVHAALHRHGDTILREDFPPALSGYFQEADLDLDSVMTSLDEIVGQQEIKDKLESIVRRLRLFALQKAARPDQDIARVEPGHYLFRGNPGTGKSTIAVKFAQILGALRLTGRFEPTRVTGTMFVQALEREGVAGMRRIIDKARGGVLFIDEAHQLLSIPGALQLLLDPMIELRSELCVILACYDDQAEALFSAEPGLRSRLSAVFYFADYTAEELTQIFVGKLTRAGYRLADGGREAALAWMSRRRRTDSVSHNGRYAEMLLAQVQERMADRLADRFDEDLSEEELFTVLPQDMDDQSAASAAGQFSLCRGEEAVAP